MCEVITKHARKRVHSRARVSGDMVGEVVQKAFRRGLRHNQTQGELRRFCDRLYLSQKQANNIRVYNKVVYLFRGKKLLTVINLPKELIQIEQQIRHERKGKINES
jgi:hypothetical protein